MAKSKSTKKRSQKKRRYRNGGTRKKKTKKLSNTKAFKNEFRSCIRKGGKSQEQCLAIAYAIARRKRS